ncbi:PLD nuclease N-terminal domain-containing protein [Exiguobacterium artemiae]|uniref:PLD nuclease N-terminal domain-containing protein n=1 Tax=Exiguobacterium artemiae TaxID=340145 RepID=UPI0029654A73|nr:PLD nuclease N-terminal domain-containing protein [Exiguobacterium sibiricum]MDW2886569.1 PLD nuclease N-terminal domain-containing protein [Exiguobacterium sibiricum]
MNVNNRKCFNNIIHLLGFVLMVAPYLDLWKRPKTRGPKWIRGILIFLVNYLGPIGYLFWGRRVPPAKIASRPH